ncbi:unnamed protein product [Auanema sp. JU1783]|nr:unnamed protein product [Auanema sp. JU1783]
MTANALTNQDAASSSILAPVSQDVPILTINDDECMTGSTSKDDRSAKSKDSRRRRTFAFNSAHLRTSKFWLRLVRPWKWKLQRRKVRRSSSARSSSRSSTRIACPASPSLPDIRTVLLEKDTQPVPFEKRRLIADSHHTNEPDEEKTCEVTIVKVRLEDKPTVSHIEIQETVVDEEETDSDTDSTESNSAAETPMDKSDIITSDLLLEGYDRIQVKEPDLNAQPERPVLKKPGQPSRLRLRKKPSKRKSDIPREDGLPTHLTDDSDSDGPIQYRDDDEPRFASSPKPVEKVEDPEDEEEVPVTGLAAKVHRKDTLALRIDAPPCKDDISGQTADDRRQLMHTASIKLARKLSERPSVEELEERNILKRGDDGETMEEKRKLILRKLSFRPTIAQLKEQQIIQFNDYVEVTQAEIYDRKGDKPWTRLTPIEKALIRKELNDFKATEMDVHEESKIFTRFECSFLDYNEDVYF